MTALLLGRFNPAGYWSAEAHGPVVVADPDKARQLLGLGPRPAAGDRLSRGLLPLSTVRRALPLMSAAARREFERLLSGAGRLWSDEWRNIVVDQGLDDLLDVTLSGATQDTTWFVGLTDGTPTVAAGDTLASHAGWVEVTAYDEVNRVAWVDGGVAARSVSNSGSPANFTINATVTIGGSFLAGINTGTAGRLYAAGAFSAGDKTLNSADTLAVTATFTTAAA